ncbi:hypothetical protein ACS0TY_031553 [Phlomoides rotata]
MIEFKFSVIFLLHVSIPTYGFSNYKSFLLCDRVVLDFKFEVEQLKLYRRWSKFASGPDCYQYQVFLFHEVLDWRYLVSRDFLLVFFVNCT